MIWNGFYDCRFDSSWQIAKVSILANYKQNTPHAMGRFICLMRLPLIFSLPVAKKEESHEQYEKRRQRRKADLWK